MGVNSSILTLYHNPMRVNPSIQGSLYDVSIWVWPYQSKKKSARNVEVCVLVYTPR